jgi:DNA-binding transcriptional ArsR family regulator
MKFRKRTKYQQVDLKLARIARAMAHPARITILRYISLNKSCCFNEIAEILPLAESTVSQHITELKKAGLIKGNPVPPKVHYSICAAEWKAARKSLKEFTRQIAGKKPKT